MTFQDLFSSRKPLIAVIHLPPLPGAPRYSGQMQDIFNKALEEAETFEKFGADAIIVENFGDAPFYPDVVPAETVAAMSAICREVVQHTSLPIGVNVLRNDAHAAMAITAATGAQFIRVNVHSGAVLADQGIIQGKAWHTLRLRAQLQAQVLIFADVGVKHAAPLADMGLAQEAHDVSERGMVDALIVSGTGTGAATSLDDLHTVKNNSSLPVLIGSGTRPDNLADLNQEADGFIVGSHFKLDGKVTQPIDPQRLADFVGLYGSVVGSR